MITGALAMAALAVVPASATAARTTGQDDCRATARGRLVDTVALGSVAADEATAELSQSGLGGAAAYGVDYYRVVYCTVTASGAGTVASGLLALPHGAPDHLPVVVYAHGTLSARTDAPSFST